MKATTRRVCWTLAAALLVAGATWLASMIWYTNQLGFRPYGTALVGGVLAGVTIARATGRGSVVIAAVGALVWTAVQAVALQRHNGYMTLYAFRTTPSWLEFGAIAALSTASTIAAATPRLRGRPDHPALWLWFSALAVLGSMVTAILLVPPSRGPAAAIVFFMLSTPLATGALVQCLAPTRRIWVCGGGAWIYILILLDRGLRSRGGSFGDKVAILFGAGIFILLGALGARLGWRLFRNADPRTPPTTLPTATSSS